MEKSGGKHPQVWGIEYAKLGAFFRNAHPHKTAAAVAARLGASERTVENWLEGVAQPSARWLIAIVAEYGAAGLAACMTHPPAWLDGARRDQARAALAAEIAALTARLDHA